MLKRAFGGGIPRELGLPEEVRQGRGDGAEIPDKTTVELSQAMEASYIEERLRCGPSVDGGRLGQINRYLGGRDNESEERHGGVQEGASSEIGE